MAFKGINRDQVLAKAGQRVLENKSGLAGEHQKINAFIAMRTKPPAATFSHKAMNYNTSHASPNNKGDRIAIKANY